MNKKLWQVGFKSAQKTKKDLEGEGYTVRIRKLIGKYYVGKDRSNPKTIYGVYATKKTKRRR